MGDKRERGGREGERESEAENRKQTNRQTANRRKTKSRELGKVGILSIPSSHCPCWTQNLLFSGKV
jgi:hypothetical protein